MCARMNKWIDVSVALIYCKSFLFSSLWRIFIYDLVFWSNAFFLQEVVSPRAKAALYCFPVSHALDLSAETYCTFLRNWTSPLTSDGSNKLYRRRNWSGGFCQVSTRLHIAAFPLAPLRSLCLQPEAKHYNQLSPQYSHPIQCQRQFSWGSFLG